MTKEEAKKQIDIKSEELQQIRKVYSDMCVDVYRKNYLGKFIKWYEISNSEMNYMYVYNIWDGRENNIYFEGVYFKFVFSEYADCTFADWTQFHQHSFSLSDFNEDTGEFRQDYITKKPRMVIISREEFMETFNTNVQKMIKEHEEFEYEPVRNDC